MKLYVRDGKDKDSFRFFPDFHHKATAEFTKFFNFCTGSTLDALKSSNNKFEIKT